MKKKMSRTQKSLLYALIGSSLFWHAPVITYAAEDGQIAEEQQAAGKSTAEQREFTLQGVEVTADRDHALPPAYAGGQVARGANLGVLGNKDFMDTPFSITSYTAQTMEDQQASTLYDVLINDSSTRFTTSGGHLMENYSIRGLDLNYEHLYFNGMQGLAPFYHVPVEFLERVEVLKGPSSFLYGGVNTSVGGAINLVPKRAGDEDTTTFTADYTSSSHLGGHIDLGHRFGKNKEFGIRFNGVYKDGDTETDSQSKERILGALGMDYRHDKLRLSLDAYGSQESYDNGSVSMYDLSGGYVKAPDGSTNVLEGTYGKTRNNSIVFKSEYDIRDNLTAYASMGKLSSRAVGFLSGNHVVGFKANGDATVNLIHQNWWTDNSSAEAGLRGNYKTGSVDHQLIVGYNSMKTESATALNRINNIATNVYTPASLAAYLSTLATPSKSGKTSETNLSSLFLADTLSFDDEKVQLTLGLRRQDVKTEGFNATTGARTSSYSADATTPMVGITVKPWGESVALYANYIEALSPGITVGASYANAGEVLAPFKSKQHELGVKWDKGNFANTFALFEITKPSNMVVSNVYSYDGNQKNRGIEWNTFGKIADNVRLFGGITYLRGKITSATSTATVGNTPGGIPKWLMNAGVEWDTPWNPDLALSFRAVYTSSQYINNTNTVTIPSWVRYDLGARYQTVINKTPVTFRANVENVFDKHYWSGVFSNTAGYVTLGGPRTFKLSATMQL